MNQKFYRFIYLLLGAIAIIEIAVFTKAVDTKRNVKVLGEKVTPVPTIVTTNTPSPTSTPTSTPTPTPKPTTTTAPAPTVSPEEIYKFIDSYSISLRVDPNVIRHIALCESGFNPSAENLYYQGLFQFNISTWQSLRKKMGENTSENLRKNAFESVKTAVYAVSKGIKGIWPNCYP